MRRNALLLQIGGRRRRSRKCSKRDPVGVRTGADGVEAANARSILGERLERVKRDARRRRFVARVAAVCALRLELVVVAENFAASQLTLDLIPLKLGAHRRY